VTDLGLVRLAMSSIWLVRLVVVHTLWAGSSEAAGRERENGTGRRIRCFGYRTPQGYVDAQRHKDTWTTGYTALPSEMGGDVQCPRETAHDARELAGKLDKRGYEPRLI
jgi:hypothetical protein